MRIPFGAPAAIACITGGDSAPCLHGTLKLYAMGKEVLAVTEIHGLPVSETGIFALHIHDGQTCEGREFSGSGSHFNPENQPHPIHAGDLPPLFSCHGKAFLAVLTDRFSIRQVIGKTVVIHGNADDFTSQPAGNAGKKIACGMIMPA